MFHKHLHIFQLLDKNLSFICKAAQWLSCDRLCWSLSHGRLCCRVGPSPLLFSLALLAKIPGLTIPRAEGEIIGNPSKRTNSALKNLEKKTKGCWPVSWKYKSRMALTEKVSRQLLAWEKSKSSKERSFGKKLPLILTNLDMKAFRKLPGFRSLESMDAWPDWKYILQSAPAKLQKNFAH